WRQRVEIEQQDKYKMQVQEEQAAQKMKVLQALRLQPLNYVNGQIDLALLLSVEAALRARDQPEVLASLLTILTTNLDVRSMFPGHAGTVRAVRYSPDWKVLAAAFFDEKSNEGVVVLRDAEGG